MQILKITHPYFIPIAFLLLSGCSSMTYISRSSFSDRLETQAGCKFGQAGYPMAIVILGGLMTSALLNLFFLPRVFWRFGKAKNEKIKS